MLLNDDFPIFTISLKVIFFNHSKSWYSRDNYEILIRILPFFLNRNINIIMDCYYDRNPWNYIYHKCHHHHVVLLAQISLILSRHFSLSFIASGRSSGLHPVSSYSCCMYVWAGCPAFARPYAGVHRSTSFMSSSLLLQQCPACLRLTKLSFNYIVD